MKKIIYLSAIYFSEMKVLAIIPARGGSKGLPRKNIKPLLGKPLIVYTIEAAKASKYINRIIVSTEDTKIAEISEKYGIEVIFRPEELAKDDTPLVDVVIHVLEVLKKKEKYEPDIVILLQPTSPLRSSSDIDHALEIFLENKKSRNCLSLVSVTEVKPSVFWALKIEKGYLRPVFNLKYLNMIRQVFPKIYKPNGALYITTPEVIYKYKTFYTEKTIAYIMPPEKSIDIDTELDFLLAELLMKRKL